MKFEELNLKNTTLKAIKELGFTEATEIQEKAIPILLSKDTDFIGQAQTGTGKTAAFALPLIEKIDTSLKGVQSIILAPTRELANQISSEIEKLSQFDPIKTFCVYGGVPVYNQVKGLKQSRPHIVVGTPGRVLDLINRKALDLSLSKYFVLDEADEMLDMGFFDDVNEILSNLESSERKIWMFSATLAKGILTLIQKHFDNPEEVRVTKKVLTADSIDQKFIVMQERNISEALARYLDYHQNIYAIVFTKTKLGAKRLSDDLSSRGFDSDALHGDMVQDQRDITMNKFKQKKVKILVCTDVAARGIDVNDLTHVINICLPQDNESYVHRIGRTGRGGSKGVALSFIPTSELRRLKAIERITKAPITEEKLPTVEEIKSVLRKKSYERFMSSIARFNENENEKKEAEFNRFFEEFSVLDKEEILKGVFNTIHRDLRSYNGKVELEVKKARSPKERNSSFSSRRGSTGLERRGDRRSNNDRRRARFDEGNYNSRSGEGERSGSSRSRGAQKGYERFFLALGRNDGIRPGSIVKMVAEGSDMRGADVGRIDIKDSFSFFEVPSNFKNQVLKMDQRAWGNRTVSLEVAKR